MPHRIDAKGGTSLNHAQWLNYLTQCMTRWADRGLKQRARDIREYRDRNLDETTCPLCALRTKVEQSDGVPR